MTKGMHKVTSNSVAGRRLNSFQGYSRNKLSSEKLHSMICSPPAEIAAWNAQVEAAKRDKQLTKQMLKAEGAQQRNLQAVYSADQEVQDTQDLTEAETK